MHFIYEIFTVYFIIAIILKMFYTHSQRYDLFGVIKAYQVLFYNKCKCNIRSRKEKRKGKRFFITHSLTHIQ